MKLTGLDEAAVAALAGKLAAPLTRRRAVVYLQGPLGAGKTTLVRYLLRALGHEGAVKSPSYGLVEPYRLAGRDLFHLDLYRLTDPEELEFLGIRDLASEADLLLIEWPEKGDGLIPSADLVIVLTPRGDGRREVDLQVSDDFLPKDFSFLTDSYGGNAKS